MAKSKKIRPRISEGEAILDTPEFTMEEYSERMKKSLGSEYRSIVKHIIKVIDPPEDAAILEVGPGPGWIGIWLAKERLDVRVDGLEPSADMQRVAIKNAKDEGVSERVNYITGYVENMEMIPDQKYDLVFSNDSLHHWENPLKGFEEISRVLKPDGKVYIQDERRDLGLRAKFVVHVLGRLIAGNFWKYWKSSIDASYTPQEVQQFLEQTDISNWFVNTNFLGISIETK